ncbi:HNH endonuclease [Candidatus Dojkabacteria bacterium]|jgi:hypothetical protein|nr:HNH endonuclease [Candidatus Dojkabacteria bacterium]
MTNKHKRHISEALRGNPKVTGRASTPEAELRRREKIGKAHKGMKHPWSIAIGKRYVGAKNHFWKGGICTKERIYFLNRRRYIMKKGAEGSHTLGEWELLKIQYGLICPCCKKSEPEVVLTEDHIIPLSKGGSDFIENIQPLCGRCNCKKYTKIVKYEP